MLTIVSLVITMWIVYEAWFGLSELWSGILAGALLIVNGLLLWRSWWCGHWMSAIACAICVGIALWQLYVLWAYEEIDEDEQE